MKYFLARSAYGYATEITRLHTSRVPLYSYNCCRVSRKSQIKRARLGNVTTLIQIKCCIVKLHSSIASYDFIDLGAMDAKSRDDPLLAATADTCPVIIAKLGAAFLVRTCDLARKLPVPEEEFHPLHRLDKIARTL